MCLALNHPSGPAREDAQEIIFESRGNQQEPKADPWHGALRRSAQTQTAITHCAGLIKPPQLKAALSTTCVYNSKAYMTFLNYCWT